MNGYLDVAVEAAREGGAILLAEFDRPLSVERATELLAAAPDFDEIARLPCLATGTPAPATMSALDRRRRRGRAGKCVGVSLVRRSAGRHHELRAQLSVLRGFDRA